MSIFSLNSINGLFIKICFNCYGVVLIEEIEIWYDNSLILFDCVYCISCIGILKCNDNKFKNSWKFSVLFKGILSKSTKTIQNLLIGIMTTN